MHKTRIKCPPIEMSRKERIGSIINDEFSKWIFSSEMQSLLELFLGAEKPNDCNILDYCFAVRNKVAEIWDYRKHQRAAQTRGGEAARWLIKNTEFVQLNQSEILQAAEGLGLIVENDSFFEKIDYILPLGGARLSNLHRPHKARDIAQIHRPRKAIIALSGFRPLDETEMRGYIDTFAPEAKSEFEAISKGMQIAFDVHSGFEDVRNEDKNVNLCSTIRKYRETFNGTPIYSVAAPSTDASRRANSADCFAFFFEQFKVDRGSRIVNCTSQIYTTYQHIRALSYAIDYNVMVDTVGVAMPFEAVNYLQEIKGTLDAMCDFCKKYGREI